MARAVCPPDGLTTELIEATVDNADAYVGALGPTARRALLTVAQGLERATRLRSGIPFSALDPADARVVLDRWRRGPMRPALRLIRDIIVLAHYEVPEVRAAVGYLPDPFVAAKAAQRGERWSADIATHRRLLVAPAPLSPSASRLRVRARESAATAEDPRSHQSRNGVIRPGAEMPSLVECDVVVVGSGAGGGVVAAELAEAGLSVVVLEEGEHHSTESFTTSTLRALQTLYREGGAMTTLGRAPIGYAEGRCVGGGTVVNGGMAFRASESTLSRWATTSGDRTLAGHGLDAHYERVERFLSVGLPDPGSIGRDQDLLRLGAERLGWRVVDDRRNHVHCGGCNVCTWGCPTGAKQSTLVSYLPRALAFGATVWAGCRVDRVLMTGKQAVGVRGHVSGDAGRARVFEARARHVVVCAGAIQTAALLLRSGVQPPSGQLGRNLSVHPGAGVAAVFDEVVEGWKGAHQSLQVREFERDGIILAAVNLPPSLVARSLPLDGAPLGETMTRYNQIVTAGVLVEDTGTGRVRALGRSGAAVTYPVAPADAGRVASGLLRLSEALLAAGAHTVHLPIRGQQPLQSREDVRRASALRFRAPDMDLSTVHLMGTARIGTDPLWAVCDPYGAVHDARGLSVADASLFPGAVGVNPMLTIMALATRVAERIIETW
ncbi:oxidoreductase [Intrasporangium oryzae NRRL B-24470]|uniref:Oxidoreductase n=1 Tax=Intrasporangium oryzae NRRL B-24470 TaxID=1386089 RepID=W9GEY2_9MICO|nr:GMC family oxidoreductase [Intrasporangium oryzae]EWT03388.1 oxidoreductase [Intrasporangium oryzae NRRL B-24470]